MLSTKPGQVQRACRRNLAWGKRGRAELALVYHRPINSNFLLKIVGHVLVLLGHFDYANSVSKEIGSDSLDIAAANHAIDCFKIDTAILADITVYLVGISARRGVTFSWPV